MAKYKYVVKNVPKDAAAMEKFVIDEFGPLIETYWDTYGKALYGKPIAFDMNTFVMAWVGGSVFLLMVYDEDGEAVGFMVGMKFRPIFYETHILQIERWYGPDEEVVDGMFDYVNKIVDIMGVHEVYVTRFQDGSHYKSGSISGDTTQYTLDRIVR